MQDSLRDLMEAAGLVARCFGSAEEFLASDLHNRAACLIVDIGMPTMSGLQLRARLKDGVLPNPLPKSAVPVAAPPITTISSDPQAAVLMTLRNAERALIVQTLEATDWRIGGPNGAAVQLGLNRTTLMFRMKKLGI